VPLPGQPGVCTHGLALAELLHRAFTERADNISSMLCQFVSSRFPLMDPAIPMGAAIEVQPDFLVTLVGENIRLLALSEVWVPPGLYEVVIRVRQSLPAFGIEPWTWKTVPLSTRIKWTWQAKLLEVWKLILSRPPLPETQTSKQAQFQVPVQSERRVTRLSK